MMTSFLSFKKQHMTSFVTSIPVYIEVVLVASDDDDGACGGGCYYYYYYSLCFGVCFLLLLVPPQ